MFLIEGLQDMGVGLEQELEDMPKVVPIPNRGTTAWAQQVTSVELEPSMPTLASHVLRAPKLLKRAFSSNNSLFGFVVCM